MNYRVLFGAIWGFARVIWGYWLFGVWGFGVDYPGLFGDLARIIWGLGLFLFSPLPGIFWGIMMTITDMVTPPAIVAYSIII